MKSLLTLELLSLLAPTALGYPDRASTGNSKCPFGRRRTSEEYEAMKVEREARIAAWEEQEASMDLPERLYMPGVKNDGEEYCDGSEDYKYCNKMHGPWGDSIPQNGTYCLWAILEFQDPAAFDYGQENSNSSAFNGMYEATFNSVVPLFGEQQVLLVGSTGGQVGGNPEALPWPTASIIWSDGNKYAKDWIANTHRSVQAAGYDMGFIFHGHYKAVSCSDIEPMLGKHGLLNGSAAVASYWVAEGIVSGGEGFRRYWNAFSDMEDHSPQFYQPAVPCVLGPCPVNATATDAETPEETGTETEQGETGAEPEGSTEPEETPSGESSGSTTNIFGWVGLVLLSTLF